MSDFSLDGNNITGEHFKSRAIFGQEQTPKMVGWVMKIGINKKASEYILIALSTILTILMFIVILVFIFNFGSTKTKSKTTNIEDLTTEQKAELPPQLLNALQRSKIKSRK